ncbi:uncharacterized protein LOC127107932 isoform X3 [Lathyrus oleraceus]|uniref:uncharacterized protein LOC127107932 isoform X1 n=1 Tax=Pisum sativum TaxID=3888 RepID=UPI0021D083A5|nr:uncharacterized protein LOC127107932 isoform X1 [Pisum sativum]XP_050901236.1 uncharacterized protein LOC127107932 isoform X2 [Pisum sativum]XP_050901238.1 uncharacterized protein LOC127107932 isoform X3 [Pisum sativum]
METQRFVFIVIFLPTSRTPSSSEKTLPHRSLNLVRTYLSFSPKPSQTRSLYLTKIVLSQLSTSLSHSHDISINKHMRKIKRKKEKYLQSVAVVAVKNVQTLASRVWMRSKKHGIGIAFFFVLLCCLSHFGVCSEKAKIGYKEVVDVGDIL